MITTTIKTVIGDVLKETTGIIVHQANCQGVMGSGIAKQIKEQYPKAYQDYLNYFKYEQFSRTSDRLGAIVGTEITDTLHIFSILTQDRYGRDPNVRYTNYAALGSAFREVVSFAHYRGLPIKFPLIGAGTGNGDWKIIEQIINDADPENLVPKFLFIL